MSLTDLPFQELKKGILSRRDLSFDFEFARRVIERMEPESEFFFGEFSIPFLQSIAASVAHANSYRDLLGFYYDFVSAPLTEDENGIEVPSFQALRSYKGRNGAHLYSYLMSITWRHAVYVYRKPKRGDLIVGRTRPFDFERAFLNKIHCEDQEAFITAENKEIGWEILNAFFYEEAESEQEHRIRLEKIKKGFDWLQEKDRLVLQYLVIDEMTGLKAFDLLKSFLRPKMAGTVELWSDKKKQDTMSLWKTRALAHLETIVKNPNLKV